MKSNEEHFHSCRNGWGEPTAAAAGAGSWGEPAVDSKAAEQPTAAPVLAAPAAAPTDDGWGSAPAASTGTATDGWGSSTASQPAVAAPTPAPAPAPVSSTTKEGVSFASLLRNKVDVSIIGVYGCSGSLYASDAPSCLHAASVSTPLHP